MRKRSILIVTIIILLLSLIILPNVLAAVPGPFEAIADIWDKVLEPIFTFEWAKTHGEETFGAFARFVIWIILFTVLHAVGVRIFPANRRHATIVAGLISVLCVIFIPIDLLLAIGEIYSTVGAVVFLAVPCVGLLYLIHLTGTWGWSSRARALFNIFIIILVWILVNIISTAVEGGL